MERQHSSFPLGAFGVAVAGCLTAAASLSGIERLASGIGISLVSLLAVALTWGHLDHAVRSIFLLTVAIFAAIGAAFGWSGWSEHESSLSRADARQQQALVTSTIQAAANAEASWYEHPG